MKFIKKFESYIGDNEYYQKLSHGEAVLRSQEMIDMPDDEMDMFFGLLDNTYTKTKEKVDGSNFISARGDGGNITIFKLEDEYYLFGYFDPSRSLFNYYICDQMDSVKILLNKITT